MKQGLIFANACAKAKELNLFTEERLHRMIEASSFDDAVRILFEVNYAGGMIVESKDYEKLLIEEERLVNEFVRGVIPEKAGFECFFLKNDYHNFKTLLKVKFGKLSEYEQMLLPDGTIPLAVLKEKLNANKLDFNIYMAKAYQIISTAFETGTGSPRVIDVEVDKAMYRDIKNRLSKNCDKYIKEYFITLIDTTNILSFLRVIRLKESFKFFADNFIDGGEYSIKFFEECTLDYNKIIAAVSGTKYKAFAVKLENGDLPTFETARDNFLLSIFSTSKTDMFSVAPIVGYYLAKQNEIKVLRLVLICKKNGVPQNELKKRVRNLYA